MAEYLLLIRGGADDAATPEALADVLQQYRVWAQNLQKNGQLVDVAKLVDDGVRLRKGAQAIQVDGPFIETKETIGGFYIVKADSYDVACRIAQDCPVFEMGGCIEVRAIQQ